MISVQVNKRGIFIPLLFLFSTGCSTLPMDKRTYADDGKQIVAREKKVEVHISKEDTVWNVFYVNNGNKPKCVGTVWETMDLVKKIPEQLIYVNSKTTFFAGQFIEIPWQFDQLTVMVEGSGIVEKIYVLNPHKDRKDCLYPKGKTL